jgi:hypothetical protein
MKIAFLLFAFILIAFSVKAEEFTESQKQYLSSENILKNPGFESGLTGWTNSAGVITSESTTFIKGKKSAKIVLTAQTATLVQSSTLYAGAFADGVQGLATCRIKSSVALKFCSRNAGVTSTSNCVDVNNGNTWGLYKLPTILNSVSNGISIASTGAVTGTVFVDDCFLGAQGLTQNIDASKIAGESFFAGTTSCNWARASTVIGAFTAAAACPGPTLVYQSMGQWQTTDSDLPRQTINNLPAGKYKATFQIASYMSAVTNPAFAITDGSTTCEPMGANGSTSLIGTTASCVFNYTSSGNRVFELHGGSPTGTLNVGNQPSGPRSSLKFNLEYFGSDSTYSSQTETFSSSSNALTHKATAIVSTDPVGTYNTYSYAINTNTKTICASAPTILPNVTDGFKIFARNYSVASTCGNPARVEIKIGLGMQVIDKELYKNTGKSIPGNLDINALDNVTYGALANDYDSTTGVLIVDVGWTATVQPTHSLLFSDVSAQANGFLFINASKNSSLVIGSFSGIEKCADSYECTDTFSAKVSAAGIVTGENLDWITSTAIVDTSRIDLTFKTGVFTVSPNCNVSVNSGTISAIANIDGAASTSIISVRTVNSPSTKTAYGFEIRCSKQGADYIGKTAKAVASDQNVRSIGAVGVDVQSVYFGSGANCATACSTGNCAICKQVGSKITSVAFVSTGIYTVNGVDGLTKYSCSGSAFAGGNYGVINHDVVNSTSTTVRLNTGNGPSTVNAGYAHLTCIGIP